MTCNELQKDLALMAVGALDQTRLALVSEHVRGCPGCAARLHDYESVCAAHLSAAGELKELRVRSNSKILTQAQNGSFSTQSWRWLIPLAGAAAAILLLTQRPVSDQVPSLRQPAVRTEAVPNQSATGTLARYRQALARPGEGSLDSLLARDADSFLRAPSRSELQQLRSDVF
jgi:hypothetical protein